MEKSERDEIAWELCSPHHQRLQGDHEQYCVRSGR